MPRPRADGGTRYPEAGERVRERVGGKSERERERDRSGERGIAQVTGIPNNPATQPELYLPDVVGDEAGVSDALVTGGGSVEAATRAATIWSISANCSAEKADYPVPAGGRPRARRVFSCRVSGTDQTDPKKKKGASSRAVEAPLAASTAWQTALSAPRAHGRLCACANR